MPIEPSDVELAYRAEYHQDSQYIDRKRIACATCGTSLTAKLKEREAVFVHPLLDTLQCRKCHLFYGDGDFSMDEDGSDKYCRMCGNGGELYICGNQACPFGFCQKCIHRHLGGNSDEVESDDWNCLHCNCKPLWEVRAVCAVIALERSRKPGKHRKETTGSERNDDSSRSEDSDSDLENTRPRSSRSRLKSENKCSKSNTRKTSRHGSKDSHDSIGRRGKSNVSRKSRTSQKYVLTKAARPSSPISKVRELCDSSDDESLIFEEDRVRHRIGSSTKSIDAFAEVKWQPLKKHNNGDSNHSIKQQQKIQPSLPKVHRTKVVALKSLKNLTSNSDSTSGKGSANEFVRSKKKKKFKSSKNRLGMKDANTHKVKGNHLDESNSKANPSRSTEKIQPVMADRKTPESSLESKRTSRESSTHSFNDLGMKTTTNKIQRNRSSSSESDKKTENPKYCSNTADVLRDMGTNRHLTDSENENISVGKVLQTKTKVGSPNLNEEPEKTRTTKRLSTKPHHQTYLNSSSAEYDKQFLETRKASIKLCQRKFASTKDTVTKDHAMAMRKHAENLMREMKMLRVGSSAGAEKIIRRHLSQNETSVAAISKMVQTCALLLVRCKEKWVRIEREFLDSYKDWCRRAEIESIFADMDNPEFIATNEVEKPSVGKSMENKVTQNRNRNQTLGDSTDDSDFLGDGEDNWKKTNQLPRNLSSPISKTANIGSGTKEKLESISTGLGNNKRPPKVNRSTIPLSNKDSDGDSITSKNDELSECDSNEIFSEDENRGRTDTATKALTGNISRNSPTPNTIESDSNGSEKVVKDNLETPGEESTHSGEVEGHRLNLSDNIQQNDQAADKLSRIQVCTHNTDQLKSSQDIFEDHPNNASKAASPRDQYSLNASSCAEDISMSSELSASPQMEVPGEGTNESLDDSRIADALPLATLDGGVDDVSGCEQATILDHSISHDSTTNSETHHSIKSPESAASVDKSKKTESLSVEDAESMEIELQNDIGVKSDELKSSKDTSLPIVSNSNVHKGATGLDSDISLEEESDAAEVCNERLKNEKIITHSTALLNREKKTDFVGENDTIGTTKNQTIASRSDGCIDFEAAIESNKSESDSEEAIKRKILESDSELSNDSSEGPFPPNSFKLTVTSSSEEYPNKEVPADPGTATITTSEVPNVGKKSEEFESSDKELETNSTSPASVVDANDNISIENNLAKQRLLSDSDSSSSDERMLNPLRKLDRRKSDSTSSQSNDEIFVGTINNMESTSMPRSKWKRRKFNVEHNNHYKTDKKLQMDCKVLVRRLKEKDLEPFSRLLIKSREHQELQNFESLVDLDNIKKRKQGSKAGKQSGSGSESSLSESLSKEPAKKKKSTKVQEKEETLLDHFEKMKNGEKYCNLSGDETDEDNVVSKSVLPGAVAEKEIIMQSNQVAKAKLMQSSDSENDMQTSICNDDEPEPEEKSKVKAITKKQKAEDVANEEVADAESSQENGSNTEKDNDDTANVEEETDPEESDSTRRKKRLKQGLAARNWRLTDSDSSSQERKWTKSQESKEEKDSVEPKEISARNKKKVKRRVLGSDSDSVKLTDLSDESAEEKEAKKNSSDSENSSEIFENLRKKKRKKRNAGQNSETTSESGQDAKSAKQKRKRIKKMASDSDSDSDNPNTSQDTPGKLQRKNIRKVLKDKQVADVTKIAGKEEEERLKRIAERQKLYNEMYEMKLATETKVDKLILDFDEETKKELISVHEGLVKRLKPHQAQGIKFMWDACFESLAQIKSTQGSGCIVAHCMGLGKTFQVVTLAHTLLTHAETGVKTIMVVCPLSTVLNWVNEFKKWLSDINNDEDVEVFEMTKMKKNIERKYQLERWQRAGGVMVLGYEMFRLLSNQKGKKMRKTLHEAILKCLVDPGPDLIVCDEGHLLKNEDTALSKAMRQVKTMRRIVLTGTPLQNNLVEYHCMVQFVKPNLLGTKKEFLNRFVNPITNGQFEDSTEYDVKLMKKRAHVLHKMLEGSVQRFDYSVLTPFLPPKQEYVITVRLAPIQIKLYQYYLDNLAKKHTGAGTSLFADFQALQRIWTHPIVLRMNAEKVEKANEKKRMDMDTSDTEGSLKDFLDDGSSEKSTTSADSDIQSIDGSSDDKPSKPRRGTRANPVDEATFKLEDEEIPQAGEWWNQFVEPEHFEDLRISSKLVLLFAILKEAEQIGDKVLVFSQSLYALSLIEEFLNKIDEDTQRGTCNELIDNHSGSWSLGLDYFRLDGQTAPEHRSQYCRIFNNPKNSRARLFLISTRAGGLGINLTAANRVIIFDASWNPSHDVQSIFRIYRFGQKKPCYVYRFLAQGTMEEKIYNRQVTKLSLSCRVVDEQQIDRHYSNHDLAELYQFDANTSADKPTLNLPKDRLLAEIFRKYEDRIETFHEHDSLLENKAEEELDEEERKEAWKEYEDERTGKRTYMHNFPNQNFAMQQYNDMLNMNQAEIVNRALLSGINIDTLETLIRKDYPNSTPEQQKMMTQRAIIDMYSYMESESIRQQQMAAAAAAAAANNFTYPTVSNVGAASFADKNATSQGRYALQQQQQLQQIMAQREAQANYAKRFGNVRGPALSAAPTRQQPQVVQIDDNDVMEVPVTNPATTVPPPQAQTPAVPAPGGNRKRQEE